MDPALGRRGAVDGGWWPRSRNASVELPLLVSSLNARIGAILRLGVDVRDWDDIPRRIQIGGHVVRVGQFADVNHKIIVTPGSHEHIMLLVISPQTSTSAAKSALAMAATGKPGRPEQILAASGVENEIRAVPDVGDPICDRGPRSAETDGVRPMAIVGNDERRGGGGRDDIGRWLGDGAPAPESPARRGR